MRRIQKYLSGLCAAALLLSLLLAGTAKADEITIYLMAENYQMEPEKIKSLVSLDNIREDLAVNKAIDFVKEKANIVLGAAEEEKKPAKKTTRKTTKKAAAKKDEEPKEEETQGE